MFENTRPDLTEVHYNDSRDFAAVGANQLAKKLAKDSALEELVQAQGETVDLLYSLEARLNPVSERAPSDGSVAADGGAHITAALYAQKRINQHIRDITTELVI